MNANLKHFQYIIQTEIEEYLKMKPFIIVNGILVESTYNVITLQLKKYEMKWQNDLKARKCTIQFKSIVV